MDYISMQTLQGRKQNMAGKQRGTTTERLLTFLCRLHPSSLGASCRCLILLLSQLMGDLFSLISPDLLITKQSLFRSRHRLLPTIFHQNRRGGRTLPMRDFGKNMVAKHLKAHASKGFLTDMVGWISPPVHTCRLYGSSLARRTNICSHHLSWVTSLFRDLVSSRQMPVVGLSTHLPHAFPHSRS